MTLSAVGTYVNKPNLVSQAAVQYSPPKNMPTLPTPIPNSSNSLKERDIIAVTSASLATGVAASVILALPMLKAAAALLAATLLGTGAAAALVYGLPALIIIGLLAICFYCMRSNHTNQIEQPTSSTPTNSSQNNVQTMNDREIKVLNAFPSMNQEEFDEILANANNLDLNDKQAINKLVDCAIRTEGMMQCPLDRQEKRDFRAKLSPLQLSIWDNRILITNNAKNILGNYIHNSIAKSETLNHISIHQRVIEYCNDRDANGITKQFIKDAHRIGDIDIIDSRNTKVQFLSENSEDSRTSILRSLKGLITDKEDHDLFSMLQESLLQNTGKPATEDRVQNLLSSDFGDKAYGFMPPSWQIGGVSLKKIDETHYEVIHKYTLSTLNMETLEKKTSQIQLLFPVNKDNGTWFIGQPLSTPIPTA